jgi:hypothetical protein
MINNIRDYADLKKVKALSAAVLTADATGASIDAFGYETVAITANVGASGDTLSGSVYVELEIEHSDDNSSWADAANTDIRTAVTGTNTGTFAKIDDPAEDDAIYSVQYIGGKRYVRIVANLTGTHTNGIPIGAVAVLSGARELPVA